LRNFSGKNSFFYCFFSWRLPNSNYKHMVKSLQPMIMSSQGFLR